MSPLRSFPPVEFEKFFFALDRELRKRVTVTVIGGAAIGLGYDPRHSTTDIDLVPVGDPEFWKAVERARAAHPIPVQTVPFFTPPYDYESRCTRLGLKGLKRLTILVPEVHDLAIMKAARALAHDLDAIEHIHRQHPLDLETLVARYYEARTQVTGSQADFTIGFLALIERLFGAEAAREAQDRLEKGGPPRSGGV
ncbi:MAG TPA: DUF6036 family nucleotidyltransferase [Anaeromyxobacter sp.]